MPWVAGRRSFRFIAVCSEACARAISPLKAGVRDLLLYPRLELSAFKHFDLGFYRLKFVATEFQKLRAPLVTGQQLVKRQLARLQIADKSLEFLQGGFVTGGKRLRDGRNGV